MVAAGIVIDVLRDLPQKSDHVQLVGAILARRRPGREGKAALIGESEPRAVDKLKTVRMPPSAYRKQRAYESPARQSLSRVAQVVRIASSSMAGAGNVCATSLSHEDGSPIRVLVVCSDAEQRIGTGRHQPARDCAISADAIASDGRGGTAWHRSAPSTSDS